MSFQNLHMYVKSTVVSTSLNNYNRGGCAILWANKVVTGLTLATHLNKQDSFYVTQKTCPNILHFKSWANYETFVQSLNTCVTVF